MRFLLLITHGLVLLSACIGQSGPLAEQSTDPISHNINAEIPIYDQKPGDEGDPLTISSSEVEVPIESLLGKNDPRTDPKFVEVPREMASRDGMRLHSSALDAFIQMRAKAMDDGVNLTIISATRTFDQQKRIWERKWTGAKKVDGMDLSVSIPDPAKRATKILEYSSMPGTSRHHWGTDIDINSLNNEYFATGKGKKEYEWLRDNAHEFGFCQPYSAKEAERMNGYEMEKWHWSYMPLAKEYLLWYAKKVKPNNLNGFMGSDALPFSEVLKYVTGISTDCK